jgi:hypothetical protein
MSNTTPQGLPFVRWKFLAGVPQRIFSRGLIALMTPRLEIGLGAFRQEHLPCTIEIGAGLLEGRGGARLMFAGMRARIEPAVPFPWVGIVRIADALGDRTGVHIPVIDVPAFLAGFRTSASGELGHAALKRDRTH